ncbi:MAG TPA: neutral zinc metallopeptidase [Blastocatellia bacterium]|nr:neutral zinc metallopeptidase [Blastocatellia bacterium]
MLWRGQRESSNVEDRRGMSRGGLAVGGGVGGLVILLLAMFFGVDPGAILNQTGDEQPASNTRPARPGSPGDDELTHFVSVVLASTEDVWSGILRQSGKQYRNPKLVLFSDQVQSACGVAGSSAGPFYCPGDQKVYIDLAFYRDLKEKLGAPGDFAQAYVIAHEIGHHVQKLLGISDKVHSAQSRMSRSEANDLSVRLELQADFFAGVWASQAKSKGLLETGDIEEALGAASSVGDDRLQRQAQGRVVPDSFTHGTSEQRVRWFRKGLETADFKQGDTFNEQSL